MVGLYDYIREALFLLPAEMSHDLASKLLKYGLIPRNNLIKDERLSCEVGGIKLENMIGLAAGFDKDASCVKALSNQGFACLELGSVTLKPQKGNPKPRLFRLKQDHSIINRMGFNSKGIDNFLANLKLSINDINPDVKIGINIGRNTLSTNDSSDYVKLMDFVYQDCDYINVNISCPNIKSLSDLHQKDNLKAFLADIIEKRKQLSDKLGSDLPIFLKISPDINEDSQKNLIDIVIEKNISALVVGNTTVSRAETLSSSEKHLHSQKGGLSGKPLFDLSNEVLGSIYKLSEGKIDLIGVGGVSSADDVLTKIKLGAKAVQLYTALIYEGFSLVNKINNDLLEIVESSKYNKVSEMVGIGVE